jgi:two-component system, NtrC family, nitrogen regulation sensor histidine kinase GlnL
VELWRDILDSLGDAVVVLSPELEPVAANAAAQTLLETSQVGRTLVSRLMRRNKWLRRMVDSCLTSGQSLDNPETQLVLSRRSIVVRAEVSPLMNREGRPDCAIVLLHDLSHQKGAEQALAGETNPFRLSPAGLAHEVRNPLTGIKGAAELLGSMFPGDPRAQQYCRIILDGVNRIASLVEQVLVLSASSPERLKREPVNIHQVLHQALRMAGLYPEAPAGIVVRQMFDPSLPEVSGDVVALERVFLNLIRNALEAIEAARTESASPNPAYKESAGAQSNTPTEFPAPHSAAPADGKHMILLRTAMETQFRLTAEGRRRQFLRVEISDSGKGMDQEGLKQLFTPFFTTKPGGTGLGLVLSQRIIALHGGKLWAERAGLGTIANNDASTERPAPEIMDEEPPASPMDESPGHSEGQTNAGMTFCVTLPVGPD